MKIGLVMNVKLLKNLVFLGLLSFSVFPSFAVSKIIPDGTIPYNMGVQLKGRFGSCTGIRNEVGKTRFYLGIYRTKERCL